MAFEVGDRVIVNETFTEWEPYFGKHGKIVSIGDPDQGATPERPISVWLDGVRGSSPFFKESELDPEVL
jgi:hypothetical protein